jgi:outer membrane receptor protein involved in Fe transport
VPFNVFAIGGISQAALDYVQLPARESGSTRERVVSGSVTGDLGFDSPLAMHPIAVAFGAEYRDEALSLSPDASWQAGDLAGGAAGKLPISGSFDVKEVFSELRAPLVEEKPFFHSLSAEAGVRYSEYSNAGSTTTDKVGLEWSPTRDVRFRTSFQHAVRAPNLVELFAAQRNSASAGTDPCEGPNPRATQAQCLLAGVSAAQYRNVPAANGQLLGALIGGNPNLTPEKSNTRSVGVQLTPSFLPGVSLTVDYFNIGVTDLIGTVPITLTLNQCVASGSPVFCSLIHRNAQGSLVGTSSYVVATSLNTGFLKTSGVDVTLATTFDLHDIFASDLGKIDVNFSGTYTDRYDVQLLPGLPSYGCAGYFGVTCGQPIPEWRHRMRVSWTSPSNVQLSGTWRYVGGTKNDKSSSDAYLAAAYQPYDARLKSVSYFDLAASIQLDKSLTLRAGVNNLFDKDPPLTASVGGQTSNGAFFAGPYDALGRYVFVGATARF